VTGNQYHFLKVRHLEDACIAVVSIDSKDSRPDLRQLLIDDMDRLLEDASRKDIILDARQVKRNGADVLKAAVRLARHNQSGKSVYACLASPLEDIWRLWHMHVVIPVIEKPPNE
jgi:hypothetical protein